MTHLKKKKKLHIDSELRILIYVWCLVMVTMLLVGASYAWYTMNSRMAETFTPNVMKPYHLEMQDAKNTASTQLSIGSLQQGETKQIVFSVTNKEEPQKNKNKTAFEYALELIYTNNLALRYEVYPLNSVQVPGENTIATEETIITKDEEGKDVSETNYLYWEKTTLPLNGVDVSATRHSQAGVTGSEINSGTYISYEKRVDTDGITILNDNMKLDAGEESYATQFYVLEVSWNIDTGFEKYDKETDMIYIVAKAVQPKPTE